MIQLCIFSSNFFEIKMFFISRKTKANHYDGRGLDETTLSPWLSVSLKTHQLRHPPWRSG